MKITIFSKTHSKVIDDKGGIVLHFCKSFFMPGLIEGSQISTLLPYFSPGDSPRPVALGKAHCPVVGKTCGDKGNEWLCIIMKSNMNKRLRSKDVKLRWVCCSHRTYTVKCQKRVSNQENKLWKILLEIYSYSPLNFRMRKLRCGQVCTIIRFTQSA